MNAPAARAAWWHAPAVGVEYRVGRFDFFVLLCHVTTAASFLSDWWFR
ncbi:hypothetical protein Xoosp14_152 [Xanthomonas phage Xoo-sp14]|nr:hypothetical protein Xoosp14_152 [Xanthomonas phage Xoo-sp14]